MNKSGTLITSALLTLGLVAAATAANMPKTAAPMSADAPAASSTDAPKPAKKHKKHKKATAAPSTTK
jgi:hypothetical protein